MSDAEFIGTWYLQLVDQEQSEEEAEEFGEYPNSLFGTPPRKASRSPYAGAILELRTDNSYAMTVPEVEWAASRGRWSSAGGELSMTEAEDCDNGFDGLYSSRHADGRLTLAFRLVPDAHDGKDLLLFTFTREAPVDRGPAPDDPVERLLQAEDEGEMWDIYDEVQDDALPSFARALWDAWAAGRLAADLDAPNYDVQLDLLCDRRVLESGGLSHEHVLHGLRTLDWDAGHNLAQRILGGLVGLPAEPRADAEIAALIASTDGWLDELAASRFVGGGVPEAVFDSPRVPQPDADEASRAYLGTASYFTRFEAIERLYPEPQEHREELAAILIHYRGQRLLTRPLDLIRARGLEREAKAAALALLGDPDQALSAAWPSALMFAWVLSLDAGEPIPEAAIDALAVEPRYMGVGGLDPDEREQLRALIEPLPELQREGFRARLHLGNS
jgi:hypothetical protein